MWRDFFETETASADGCLFFRVHYYGHRVAFTPPLGPDPDAGLELLRAHCRETGEPFVLCTVSESLREHLAALFPGAVFATDPAWSDYLYDAEPLKTFPGKKYHGQRNHLNRFNALYPQAVFAPVAAADLPELTAFTAAFAARKNQDTASFREEMDGVREVFAHFDSYGFLSGVLRVDGAIAAYALGETVGDTLFVHIEKADTAYEGVYQKIVSEFAARCAVGAVRFINREEDDGDPGLRKSKLDYHPTALLTKYTAVLPL